LHILIRIFYSTLLIIGTDGTEVDIDSVLEVDGTVEVTGEVVEVVEVVVVK
jgi:hypothetical protein